MPYRRIHRVLLLAETGHEELTHAGSKSRLPMAELGRDWPASHYRGKPPEPTWRLYGTSGGNRLGLALMLKWDRKRIRIGMLWAAWLLEESGWDALEDEHREWRAYDLTPEALAAYCEEAGICTALYFDKGGNGVEAP